MSGDRCKTCGAPVVWAANESTGRLAPIDAAPDSNGPVLLLPQVYVPGQPSRRAYRVLTKAQRERPLEVGERRYTNHWQTCPDRESWKARKR